MKSHKRPTKLEEALLKVHMDIDGDKEMTLNDALHQVRQVVQLIIGQDEIHNHDVTLVVQVVMRERNKPADKAEDPPEEVSRDPPLTPRMGQRT